VRTPPFPLVAGFRNGAIQQFFGDCQTNGIWQAAFRFDLAEIRDQWAAGQLSVLDMELTFKETPYIAYPNGDGTMHYGWFQWRPPSPDDSPRWEETRTCWPRLARPTADWGGTGSVVPNDLLREAGQVGSFSLGDQVGDMLRFPENDRLGFLILGHNEEMHFNHAACVSKIEEVRLNVTTLAR
jgi:hypothetical protein